MPAGARAFRTVLRLLRRGRYSLLASGAQRHGRFVARLARDLGGVRFHCDLADEIAREACMTGYYEPPVTRLFQAYVPPGAIVVDAGANWGYFTLLAAHAAGATGRVIALEPDPRQFASLEANVALNGFTWVTPLRAAAASEAGRLTLSGYGEDERNRGVSRIEAGPGGGPRFDVEAISIDEVTDPYSSIDLVKIDVEGAEDLVLKGMARGLAARRYKAIVLELHPRLLRERGIDAASVNATLAAHGYRAATIDLSPAAYRRASRPGVEVASLLRPEAAWNDTDWPHLLWLC
jgi:FkbM family methyltransferase